MATAPVPPRPYIPLTTQARDRLAQLAPGGESNVDRYAAELQHEAGLIRGSGRYLDRVAIFKGLSDPARLLVCALLKRHNRLTATEIGAALALNHATVSHHMGILQEAGLVGVRRHRKWAYYEIEEGMQSLFP